MSDVIVRGVIAAGFYFSVATAVGVATGIDPFDAVAPLAVRIFLWPCAKVWNLILPGLGGIE